MYQAVYGDLEDFSMELSHAKAIKAWFRVSNEQSNITGQRQVKLDDGTITTEKAEGMRLVAKLTITAFGNIIPSETAKAPDTQLVYTALLAQKDCFVTSDVDAFEKESEAGWKAVLNAIKSKGYKGLFFEGVASVIG